MQVVLLESADLAIERESRQFLQLERAVQPRYQLDQDAGLPAVSPGGNRTVAYQFCKRLLDVLGACLLIMFLSPILLAAWAVLFWATRGRPIFRQVRVGECGGEFTLYKFRTMVLNAEGFRHEVENEQDGPVFKNRRDPRVTRLGAFLRKFSIDELPQLFNVLRGDMSLVGPRPPIPAEVRHYEPWQLRRLGVRPGLTCLWQVNGRCEIGFKQWVRMDLWYVDHQSLTLDLILLLKTPGCVLSGRGAY